jgi:hypothetical protein
MNRATFCRTTVKNVYNYSDWAVTEPAFVLKNSYNHHKLSCHWTTLKAFIKTYCYKNTKFEQVAKENTRENATCETTTHMEGYVFRSSTYITYVTTTGTLPGHLEGRPPLKENGGMWIGFSWLSAPYQTGTILDQLSNDFRRKFLHGVVICSVTNSKGNVEL